MGLARTAANALGDARWLLATLIPASLFAALSGDAGRAWLSYDRAALDGLEFWRLLTAHVVHLGASHFMLNMAGLVLVGILVGSAFRAAHWFFILVTSALAVDAGLWLLDPSVTNYVGASGALHGLLAAGLVMCLNERPVESTLLAVLLAAKLAYEQFAGPVPGAEAASGGAVIVNAHLYGTVGGVAAAIIVAGFGRRASV